MAEIRSLVSADHLSKAGLFQKWAPKPFQAFVGLQTAVFSDGALDLKTKELIAVGCAHVLRCPYCIDHHIHLAQDADASRDEIAEAIWVGVAMGASACFEHVSVAGQVLAGRGGDFCERGSTEERDALGASAPALAAAYDAFQAEAFGDGALSGSAKTLIAVACAHNTRSAFCIESHVSRAQDLGLKREQIAEAVWVGVEMGAGACFGHSTLAAALME